MKVNKNQLFNVLLLQLSKSTIRIIFLFFIMTAFNLNTLEAKVFLHSPTEEFKNKIIQTLAKLTGLEEGQFELKKHEESSLFHAAKVDYEILMKKINNEDDEKDEKRDDEVHPKSLELVKFLIENGHVLNIVGNPIRKITKIKRSSNPKKFPDETIYAPYRSYKIATLYDDITKKRESCHESIKSEKDLKDKGYRTKWLKSNFGGKKVQHQVAATTHLTSLATTPGKGTDAILFLTYAENENLPVIMLKPKNKMEFYDKVEASFMITLAHEMIHAYRIFKGISISMDIYADYIAFAHNDDKPYDYTLNEVVKKLFFMIQEEEIFTVGLVPTDNNLYKKYSTTERDSITENQIRKEHNLPYRIVYVEKLPTDMKKSTEVLMKSVILKIYKFGN
ncbi:MAG: hypothetical protein GY754_10620 [bacterium]|nr:hypothetical protein [bacterium]